VKWLRSVWTQEKIDKQAKSVQNRPKCIGSEEQKWCLETVIR